MRQNMPKQRYSRCSRGSMLHMCRVFFECLTMIKDKETALTYAQEGIRTLLEFMIAGQELIRRIPEEARLREKQRAQENPPNRKQINWHAVCLICL